MSKKRGVSPILSVIILMGIAIVGGSIIYETQNQLLITGLTKLDLRITELKLEKESSGGCFFSASLHNAGTESIDKIYLLTTLDNGEDFVRQVDNFGTQLNPSNSTIYSLFPSKFENNECGNFTLSNTYNVRFNASSSDSKFSTIKKLQVTNVTKT